MADRGVAVVVSYVNGQDEPKSQTVYIAPPEAGATAIDISFGIAFPAPLDALPAGWKGHVSLAIEVLPTITAEGGSEKSSWTRRPSSRRSRS